MQNSMALSTNAISRYSIRDGLSKPWQDFSGPKSSQALKHSLLLEIAPTMLLKDSWLGEGAVSTEYHWKVACWKSETERLSSDAYVMIIVRGLIDHVLCLDDYYPYSFVVIIHI